MIRKQIATIGLSLALVLGVAATPASAQTIADLQAQITALMAQLAALQGGTTVTTGVTFTQNLTIGSTGAEVTALQQMLVAQGHLVMPTGVAYGYFGPLTRAAVAKWQAANNVAPAVGYWGPISRAAANALGGTTTGGTVTGGTGTITTPGVEGTLTARLASTPTAVKLYENDSRKAVMGLELEANLSDIRVERLKFQLDDTNSTSDQDFYRKIADRLYVMDGSTVLTSVDLNSSTVVKESDGLYYLTITGVNYVVPKDSKKVLTIALDAKSTWDSAFNGESWGIIVTARGVRGVDGAGINQYSPTTALSARTFTTQKELISGATLKISLSSGTPSASVVVASEGTDNDELDRVTIMKFEAKAEDDDVTITDLTTTITRGGSGTATTTTVYLMDGSTVIDSQNGTTLGATSGTITFDNIDYVISRGSTRTLAIVVDIRDATAAATTYKASVAGSSQVIAENSVGDGITESGTATGETLSVVSVGPQFSLVSKEIVKGSTPIQNNVSTSTVQANFVIRVNAVGGDIVVGTTASDTPFATNAGTAGTDDNVSFTIYKSGAAFAPVVASSSAVTIPSGAITAGHTAGILVQEGNSLDIPVSFIFEGRTTAGALLDLGSYAVGISQLNWISVGGSGLQASDFMSGETTWRTSTVTLP